MHSRIKCIHRDNETHNRKSPTKEWKNILKTERAFLLEKLVERNDANEVADFKDFQTGKRERRRFQMVQRSSIKSFQKLHVRFRKFSISVGERK